MKRPFLVVIVAAAVAAAITWVVISERGGEAQQPPQDKIQNTPEAQQPLIDKIQDTLDEDAAKGRFSGELGDFVVYQTVRPEVEFVICPATIPVTDPTVLKNHELWSDALGPTGIGWACPDGEIAGVNNEGLESRPGFMSSYTLQWL